MTRDIPSPLLGTFSFAIVLLVWEVCVHAFNVRSIMLPAPSMIYAELKQNVGWYAFNAGYTLMTTLIGFVLSVAFGVLIAVLIVSARWFEKGVYPLIVAFNSVPKVAMAPLLVVWLGTGVYPQIAIAFLIAVFAIIVDGVHGLRSVHPDIEDLGKVLKSSPSSFFWKVRLPCAMPSILAGMKVSVSLALVGAIVGEFVASQRGLGYVILTAQGSFDTVRVFAALVLLAAMGMALFSFVQCIEHQTTRWKRA